MSRPVKRRSGCRSFLIFVLGMITGVVVFLGSIAGTIYVAATYFTLRKVESTLNVDIPIDNDQVMDMTLYDLGKDIYETFSSLNTLTIQDLIDKYGLPVPSDLYGIDISPIFSYPLTQIPDHLNELLDNVTLRSLDEIAHLNLESLNLPVISDNMDKPVVTAFNDILGSFNSDMTIRSMSDNFGIDLAGENALLSKLTDLPLSGIGTSINYLLLGDVINIDADKFINLAEHSLYVKTDRYEEVTDTAVERAGSLKYISGSDTNGLQYKEMRYTYNSETSAYKVDNRAPSEDKTYFRFYEYEPYDPSVHTSATEFYAKAYGNHFVLSGTDYVTVENGYFKLNDLYADNAGTAISDYSTLASGTDYYLYDEGTSTYVLADEFGYTGTAAADTKMNTDNTGYLKIHYGSSDGALQVIAYSTINSMSNVTDEIMNLPLGDLIDIDTSPASTDPKIMQSLASTPLSGLSARINTLTMSEAVAIDETSPKILQSLSDAQITNLSGSINTLTLGEAIDIDESSHVVLQRLKDTPITSVGTQMNTVVDNLALKELVQIQQYNVYSTAASSDSYLLTRYGTVAQYLYVIDLEGNYYYNGSAFAKLDATYYSTPLSYSRYSKKCFEKLLLHNPSGAYVLINGYAEAFDSENPAHATLDRFDLVTGYIASSLETVNDADGNNYVVNQSVNNVSSSSPVDADANYTKSSLMLVSLGDTTVANMSSAFSSLTMDQIVNIEADSFFDDPAIRSSTPDSLPSAIGTRLANATIGQLDDWGSLNVNPTVIAILQDVTVADFFSHLTYNGSEIVYVP